MKQVKIDNEMYDFQKVAQQASASVWYEQGETVILASVTVDVGRVVEGDFLPLTIQYLERSYAYGKFPSGFVKREGKPSDFETLTSRIIDRSLRPLFPQHYRHPTQITVMVLSYDGESDLQVCALNAASSVLYISEIPLRFPVNAVRIGKNANGFLVNPSQKERESSTLDLYVSGAYEDILMIEMRALRQGDQMGELEEGEFCEAIELAKRVIASRSEALRRELESFVKSPFVLAEHARDELLGEMEVAYGSEMLLALSQMAKSERADQLSELAQKIAEENPHWSRECIDPTLEALKKKKVRQMILHDGVRADGRGLKDVRSIEIQTNVLPQAHGSCLFRRGQTQALVVATIGGENDAQTYEPLGSKVGLKERFMLHYNFPSFCVGESSPLSAPGRRELGHGNLAKRALETSLKDGRVIRLVSEILESNGSSSMASVCGGSLALKASGVEVEKLVAGVAMGLVKEGESYAILTDIMGLEDHCGDMDFKVAGTREGITALQMDIKLGGISSAILAQAIMQAREARLYILDLMEEAQEQIIINDSIVPTVLSFGVQPEKIVEIIGQGGKTIKEIIERFGVSIDLDRVGGEVRISGVGRNCLEATKTYILDLLHKNTRELPSYEVGDVLEGSVKKIVDFGAFISLPRGIDGLLHISKLRARGVSLHEGQKLKCRILSIENHKIELDLA